MRVFGISPSSGSGDFELWAAPQISQRSDSVWSASTTLLERNSARGNLNELEPSIRLGDYDSDMARLSARC